MALTLQDPVTHSSHSPLMCLSLHNVLHSSLVFLYFCSLFFSCLLRAREDWFSLMVKLFQVTFMVNWLAAVSQIVSREELCSLLNSAACCLGLYTSLTDCLKSDKIDWQLWMWWDDDWHILCDLIGRYDVRGRMRQRAGSLDHSWASWERHVRIRYQVRLVWASAAVWTTLCTVFEAVLCDWLANGKRIGNFNILSRTWHKYFTFGSVSQELFRTINWVSC